MPACSRVEAYEARQKLARAQEDRYSVHENKQDFFLSTRHGEEEESLSKTCG